MKIKSNLWTNLSEWFCKLKQLIHCKDPTNDSFMKPDTATFLSQMFSVNLFLKPVTVFLHLFWTLKSFLSHLYRNAD